MVGSVLIVYDNPLILNRGDPLTDPLAETSL